MAREVAKSSCNLYSFEDSFLLNGNTEQLITHAKKTGINKYHCRFNKTACIIASLKTQQVRIL